MWKIRNGKTVLAIACFIVIIVTIFASIFLSSTFNSGILTTGVTAVLAIITIWYAISTEKNVKIIERGSQGKYIAEISRSIFSPLLRDLSEARSNLKDGSFLVGIKSGTITLERIHPPEFYLKEEIPIRSIQNRTDQEAVGRYVVRPASSLLKNEDNILDRHYSDIEKLSKKYSDVYRGLKKSFHQISANTPIFWNNFKTNCDSLNNSNHSNLKDYFKEKSSENPKESNYCLIFRILITDREIIDDPTTDSLELYNIEDFLDDHLLAERQFYQFTKFVSQNKEELNRWLSESIIKNDIAQFKKARADLIETIDELINKIEELLLDWKVEYYLTEDEMHLDEEYWDNSRVI